MVRKVRTFLTDIGSVFLKQGNTIIRIESKFEYFQNQIDILVYLNGNNAAEGENNIKFANIYTVIWTVKNWFAQDIFESLWWEINWNCYWVGCFVGLNRYWVQVPFSSPGPGCSKPD